MRQTKDPTLLLFLPLFFIPLLLIVAAVLVSFYEIKSSPAMPEPSVTSLKRHRPL